MYFREGRFERSGLNRKTAGLTSEIHIAENDLYDLRKYTGKEITLASS
jgi:hypothetical protein